MISVKNVFFSYGLILFFAGVIISVCFACGCTSVNGNIKDQTHENPQFRFGVLADVQYCDFDPRGKRYYRNSLNKLQKCVNDFNVKDLTFAIQLGDFIDSNHASFAPSLSVYNQLNMPHYHVLGNHDFEVDAPQEVSSVFGLEKGYYYFAYNGWRFVVLNSNDISTYSNLPESDKNDTAQEMLKKLKSTGAINAYSWNGAVGDEQKAWLTKTLDHAERSGEKAIVFTHHPIYPKDPHNLWNDTELISIMESSNAVVACISGHNHLGNYGNKNGIHYLTLKGMVETKSSSAYAIIEVYWDHLKVVGYGREPSRIL